ncbi:Gfo/Idh/MocA family oxidoreductase [Parafrankia sp. FMc6]|uniref:Gfo/Idh/MocA family protein n=1 Tax=Parafrankia soli TaxID=2599596 RepID=UPI0034D772C5
MRILISGRWIDGFLDEALVPDHFRIAPMVWVQLDPIDDVFFVRPTSARLLVTYAHKVGPAQTARKLASRYRERIRNERFLAIGLGRVIDAPAGATLDAGNLVAFVTPCHPACMERVVLHRELVRPAATSATPDKPIVFRSRPVSPMPQVDAALVGWSPGSGVAVDPFSVDRLSSWIADEWAAGSAHGDRILPVGTPVRETTRRRSPQTSTKPTAALFGLGNYAKTQILPYVNNYLDVVRVHELDPTQIGIRRRDDVDWDTSPRIRDGERADVFLIAGFHHTHAPLAIEALTAGSAAVVEKPVVTDEADLDQLVKLIDDGGRLFACYQRRHSPMNAWVREDLRLRDGGEPLSYSAVVFEEPLPRRHWYRWPTSRTRVVSNGCHWIDHFLWLNDFAKVRRMAAFRARSDVVTLSVELVNDSVLSLVLTSAGGSRYGQREYSELRANGRTVRIVDWARYEAEDNRRVFRRRRLNRLHSYPAMYRSICTRITRGFPGDTGTEIASVADLTLRLDRALEPS